jgi:sigma-B regulation protein RsbU (phosphoserine phosphatase)
VRSGRVISLDNNGGLPLGIDEDQRYAQSVIPLEPGDLLLLYTDGITEAHPPRRGSEARDLFGIERLDRLLLDCHDGVNAVECVARVRQAVTVFSRNAAPSDDQTLIAIKCL